MATLPTTPPNQFRRFSGPTVDTEQGNRLIYDLENNFNILNQNINALNAAVGLAQNQLALNTATLNQLTLPTYPGAQGQPGGGGTPIPPGSTGVVETGVTPFVAYYPANAAEVASSGTNFVYLNPNKVINVLTYGAKCDGITDDTAAVQAAFNACGASGIVEFPPGTCIISSAITASAISSLAVRGAGKNVSLISLNSTTADGLVFDTIAQGSVQVHDLTIEGNVAAVSGALLTITTAGAFESGNSVVHDCEFLQGWNQLAFLKANTWMANNNSFLNFVNYGLLINNTNAIDSGDMAVYGNFFDSSVASNTPLNWLSGGGLKFIGNKILTANCTAGLAVSNVTASGVTSVFLIQDNSIELPSGGSFGILIQTGASGAQLAQIVIQGNEILGGGTAGIAFSVAGGGGASISGVSIQGNVINGVPTSLTMPGVLSIIVDGNEFQNGSVGINVSSATTGTIGPNLFSGVTTNYSGLNASVTLLDGPPFTVATLPTVANGSHVYASDGTPNTNPVTGSGSGCLVSRQNGAWVSFGAGAGSGTVDTSAQYDIPYYKNGATGNEVTGAAISGVVVASTSGAPAALAGNTLGANNFANSINSAGVLSGAQPAMSNISDYGVNTWTPADISGGGLSLTNTRCTYTAIANLVFLYADITYPSTADTHTASISITGPSAISGVAVAAIAAPGLSTDVVAYITSTNHLQFLSNASSSFLTNANMSGVHVQCRLVYSTTAGG